jgi:hypothetical protein
VGCVGCVGCVWGVGGMGVPPTPYVQHSPDCTCCDFGHLRYFFFKFNVMPNYMFKMTSFWKKERNFIHSFSFLHHDILL